MGSLFVSMLLIGFTAAAAAFTMTKSTWRPGSSALYTNVPNAPGHDVRSSGAKLEIDPAEMKIQTALAEHQQNAPKLGFDVDVRSLVQNNHGFAVMSTNSKSNPGFP